MRASLLFIAVAALDAVLSAVCTAVAIGEISSKNIIAGQICAGVAVFFLIFALSSLLVAAVEASED